MELMRTGFYGSMIFHNSKKIATHGDSESACICIERCPLIRNLTLFVGYNALQFLTLKV
jgi:hypothetical protein